MRNPRLWQVEICPDLQSPDIEVPCTPTTFPGQTGRGPGGEALPFTGLELMLWLLVAVALVALGFWLVRRVRRARAEAELDAVAGDIRKLIAVSIANRGPGWERSITRSLNRQAELLRRLARYD